MESRQASTANGLGGKKPIAVAAGVVLVAIVLSLSLITSRRGSAEATDPVHTSPTALAPTEGQPTVTGRQSVAAVQCWTHAVVESIGDCTMPSGTAGLRYVFPSYDQGRSCVYKAYRTTTVTFDCSVDEGVLRFRWWRNKDEASGHYTGKYRKGLRTDLILDGKRVGTLFRDRKPTKGVYRLSGLMWSHFSFSVEAKSTAEVDSLLSVIDVRHPDDIVGYQLDSGPTGSVGVQW